LQIESLEKQNEDLQKQYESAELSLLNNRENINADMQKFVISEQNKMNLETAKLESQNAKVAGELELKNKQVNAEIQRTGVETEKAALETARQFSEDMGV
jgi:DNA polymerase I-like protein with 3'-5' exonuclease and polymerase domains